MDDESDTTTIEIDVSNDEMAREVALGIMGRAQDIHDNPDDEYEHVVEELRDVSHDLYEEYTDEEL